MPVPSPHTGTYKLDAAKSDSLESVMVWMGVSWMARKAALAAATPPMGFSFAPPSLSIESRGQKNTYAEGVTTMHTFADGSAHPATLTVTDDALVVRITVKDKGVLTTSYSTTDGRLVVLIVVVDTKGVEAGRARREFVLSA